MVNCDGKTGIFNISALLFTLKYISKFAPPT
nr:MAG TPA: hypothetical protein [Caudoviricetes sp.]